MTTRKPLPRNESDTPRPMRADARRNRERLLAVADEVFTQHGTSAPTEEIARRAGVGVATLFRHFPTKEALLTEVFVGRIRRMVDRAAELTNADDPGEAFFGFLAEHLDQAAAKNEYVDALTEAGIDVTDAMAPIKNDFGRILAVLLGNAQKAGAVRADLTVPDMIALFVGTSRAVEHAGDNASARKRVIDVVLAGLRPPPNG